MPSKTFQMSCFFPEFRISCFFFSEETFMGNIVSVCADDSDGSCRGCDRTVQLGGLKKYNLGDWVAMECNGDQGIKGRFVKVEAPNSHLQFAEIEIYANGVIVVKYALFEGSQKTFEFKNFEIEIAPFKFPSHTSLFTASKLF